MAVTVELPADLEQSLRAETPDLETEAKEALLVELYRQDKLTHYELSRALDRDRFETDAVLKKHNVTEDLPTDEEQEVALRRLGIWYVSDCCIGHNTAELSGADRSHRRATGHL